ncbi:GerAB/ArcD/ProY family transporter [Paenibacillus sp. MWE-103]|uniref:GerAB/ArcD/ProY family transporter n=1 Tax=Paenibacillus artemisiicola TaxID=1172618 RepID=A0ABS3W3V0_9BACL|nr:GerAB/ArcD/ProY family transporter [Paenibacillus artemisiicola]MBO7742980.1 GerAB/ArcD/ProY family transporter [Paenibacillus artemisiicola]
MDRSWQIFVLYILIHLGLIFFLYPRDVIVSAGEGHWVEILLNYGIHLLAIAVYMKGLGYSGDNDIIGLFFRAGKPVAFLILVPLALYLSVTVVLVVRILAEVVIVVFLSKTPIWALAALFLAVSGYIASKGLETLLRTGILLSFFCLPVILFIFAVSFQNVDWRYIFPLRNDFSFVSDMHYWQSLHPVAAGFSFLGFVKPHSTFRKSRIYLASALLFPFFFFAVYIPLLTFGQATSSTFDFPYSVALDSIYYSWLVFDKVTIFFLFGLANFTMLYVAVSLWQPVRIVHRWFPAFKPVYILLTLLAAAFVSCLCIPDWRTVQTIFAWNAYLRFYVLILLPLSTLLLGLRFRAKVHA